MQCPKCGREVEDNAKFCTFCGERLTDQAAGSEQPADVARKELAAASTVSVSRSTESFLAGYWSYFLRTLKHPLKAGIREKNSFYGYISLALEALFLAIGFTQLINHLTSVLPEVIGSKLTLNYFQVFLFIFFDALAIAAVTYAVIRIVYKNDMNFNAYITKYAGQGTPVLILCAFDLLIGLAGINGSLTYVLFIAAFVLLFMPGTVTLFAVANNGQIDRIYAYLITFVLSTLVQYFAIRVAIKPVIQAVQDLISSFSNFSNFGF